MLVYIQEDGALVMPSHKNGLVTKLKKIVAPCIFGIQCMAHRMNLDFGIVNKSSLIYGVEVLNKEIYRNYC